MFRLACQVLETVDSAFRFRGFSIPERFLKAGDVADFSHRGAGLNLPLEVFLNSI